MDSKRIAFIGMVLAFAFFLAGLTVALLILPPSPPQGWMPVFYNEAEPSDWSFVAYVEYPDVAMDDVAAWYADALGGESTRPTECPAPYIDCFVVESEMTGQTVRCQGVWDGPGTPVLVWSGSVQQDRQPSTTTPQ